MIPICMESLLWCGNTCTLELTAYRCQAGITNVLFQTPENFHFDGPTQKHDTVTYVLKLGSDAFIGFYYYIKKPQL